MSFTPTSFTLADRAAINSPLVEKGLDHPDHPSSVCGRLSSLFDAHFDSVDPFRSIPYLPVENQSRRYNIVWLLILLVSILVYSSVMIYENSSIPDLTIISPERSAELMKNRIFLLSVQAPEFVYLTWNYKGTSCEPLIKQYFNMTARELGDGLDNNQTMIYQPKSLESLTNDKCFNTPSCFPPLQNPVRTVPLCFLSDEEYSKIDRCREAPSGHGCLKNPLWELPFDTQFPIQLTYDRLLLQHHPPSHWDFGSPAAITIAAYDFQGFQLSQEFVSLDDSIDYYIEFQITIDERKNAFDRRQGLTDENGEPESCDYNAACDYFGQGRSASDSWPSRSATWTMTSRSSTGLPIGSYPMNPVRLRFRVAPLFYRQISYSPRLTLLPLLSAIGGSASMILVACKLLQKGAKRFFIKENKT